ncbi:MAG: polysaccharide deacetylase family protein [Pseudomonadota bacterium]
MTTDGRRLIFNFHGIGVPHAEVGDGETAYWCAQDIFLALLDRLAALRDAGHTIGITFDDGNRSDLDIAAPALTERGFTACFFVCAGRLSDSRYLGAEDLAALEDMGMTIGSHGENHVDLRRTDDQALAIEAQAAGQALARHCSGPVDSFAIPFGSYDRRVLRSLRHFRRVYASDAIRATGRERVIPRVSYMRHWTLDTPGKLAARKETLIRRALGRAKVFAKSLR